MEETGAKKKRKIEDEVNRRARPANASGSAVRKVSPL